MPTKSTLAGAWHIHHHELLSRPLPEEGGLRHDLPQRLGIGHSNSFRLADDLNYIETHYAPGRDLAVLSRIDHQEPRMVVTLGLEGDSRFSAQRGDSVEFREGYTSITTFNSSEGIRQYRGNQSVRQLRFSMSQSWLAAYFGAEQAAAFFGKTAMKLISHKPILPPSLIAAHALLNCNVAEKARGLFRQGQAMAILAGELSFLLNDTRRQTARFNPKDRATAELARDILQQEYQTPPSVAALARRVGTNQCKLKQLFHHYFGNTPYGLLLEIRMQTAYRLLQSGHCSIAAAAETVGYQHASNFSAAFGKYFGFPPKRIAKGS